MLKTIFVHTHRFMLLFFLAYSIGDPQGTFPSLIGLNKMNYFTFVNCLI